MNAKCYTLKEKYVTNIDICIKTYIKITLKINIKFFLVKTIQKLYILSVL